MEDETTSPPPVDTRRKPSTAVRVAVAGGVVVALLGGVAAAKGFASHDKNDAAAANASEGPGGRTGSGNFGNRTFGTIAKIDGDTITLTTGGMGANGNGSDATGTATIKTLDSTKFLITAPASLSDIEVGDTIQVTGTTTDGIIAATAIADQGNVGQPTMGNGQPPAGDPQMGGAMQGGPPSDANTGRSGSGGGGFANIGTVSKVDDTTITMTSMSGTTMTISTTSATSYSVSKPGSLSDLKAGQTISVTGTTDNSGVVTATQVSEGARGGFGGAQRRQTTTTS